MNEVDQFLRLAGFSNDFSRLCIDRYVWWCPPDDFYQMLNAALKAHYDQLNVLSPTVNSYNDLLSMLKHGVEKVSNLTKINLLAYTPIFVTITKYFLLHGKKYSHYHLLRWYVTLVCVLEDYDMGRCCGYKRWDDLKQSIYAPLFALSRCSMLTGPSQPIPTAIDLIYNDVHQSQDGLAPTSLKSQDYTTLQCRMVADVFGGICLAMLTAKAKKRKRGYMSVDDWLDVIKTGTPGTNDDD
jgi:hypothetical protein